MPLSPSTSRRTLPYTRAIQIDAFTRNDGLWDVDAHVTDIKTDDACLNTVNAKPIFDVAPYSDYGNTIGAVSRLGDLSLRQGFFGSEKQRLTDIQGYTYLIDLIQVPPTAAIQVFAEEVINTQDNAGQQSRSVFRRDRYHVFDDVPIVQCYPRRTVKSPALTESN